MIKINVDTKDIKRLKEIPGRLQLAIKKGVERINQETIKEAKKRVPVDLGRLKNSLISRIRETPNRIEGIVGTNVKYARYVEEGTRRHLAPVGKWGRRHGFDTEFLWVSGNARPYLRPAMEKIVETRAGQIISQEIRNYSRGEE